MVTKRQFLYGTLAILNAITMYGTSHGVVEVIALILFTIFILLLLKESFEE